MKIKWCEVIAMLPIIILLLLFFSVLAAQLYEAWPWPLEKVAIAAFSSWAVLGVYYMINKED